MTIIPARPRRLAFALVAAVLFVGFFAAPPASALRVATYNILNYSSGREAHFRTVMTEVQPDVIVVQEILSQSAVDWFRGQVLNQVNPGEWEAATFINGADTDNAMFWRSAIVDTVGHHVIGTALRDIDEWTFRPASHSSSGAEVRIYVVHLKASQGSTNQAKRLAEVQMMRARLETFAVGGNVIVTGDFNVYTSTEPAFQYMIDSANGLAGVVQDPIDRVGNWHVNSSYADIHTQSPRTVAFGGGSTGGMDDRFDMILVGPAVMDGEGFDALDTTYRSVGQDGLHFDGPLNVAPFGAVVDSTTQMALYYGSDHLPVVCDFQVPSLLVADAAADFADVIIGGPATPQMLAVGNGAPVPADELDYSFAAPAGFTAPAGGFQAQAGDPVSEHELGMDTGSIGFKDGDLIITTDDPDHPSQIVALTGRVLDHSSPSVEAGSVLLAAPLDLGGVAAGDTASAGASVHNDGWNTLQALLEVGTAQLTGDPHFFIDGGFTPTLVGGTPETWPVAFDAVGVGTGTYVGQLVFSTSDDSGLPGAIAQADLTYDLTVDVSGGGVGVTPDPAAPERTGFVAISPNPFGAAVDLRFSLAQAGPVRLAIYDVTGRRVTDIVDRSMPTGTHREAWDGRDGAGRDLSPGIYFARLEAAGVAETRKIVRVK